MKSLVDYLSRIYTDFEEDIKELGSLCTMATLYYGGRSLPQYRDKNVQQLYLLKYAYAYAYEYFLMYEKAVKDLGISGRLSVTSLGCGAMVDYWGLVSLKDIYPLAITYTGVDPVNWGYKPAACAGDRVFLHTNTTAGAYIRSMEELDADIYMFPKSISELPMSEVAVLADSFRQKKKKDRFAICISLRSSEAHCQEDLAKTALIQNAAFAGGYLQGSQNQCYFRMPEDCGIAKYEKNYRYPQKAVEALKGLGCRCRHRHQCGYHQRCMDVLNRYPVLRTKEICYQVMTFERRGRA